MKRMKNLMVIVVVMMLIAAGCGVSGAPNCSDKVVTDLVLELADKEIKNWLFVRSSLKKMGVDPKSLGNNVTYADLRQEMGITYEQMQQMKDKDAQVLQMVEEVDKQFAEIGVKLSGIRTNNSDDDMKKCGCGGSIAMRDGEFINLKYTAQYTEDGQVYVEVIGLQ